MTVKIIIDGQAFNLPPDTNPDELRGRIAQAVFRCEVEQLWLADGQTMLVNWRAVRTIQIHTVTAPNGETSTGRP